MSKLHNMILIPRYSTKEMVIAWSDENKYQKWLIVEDASLRAERDCGRIDRDIPSDYMKEIKIIVDEIDRIEAELTRHDVLAFLQHVSPQLPEWMRPLYHKDRTSYDIVDPATILIILESIDILIRRLGGLMIALKERAEEYKYLPAVGRSHGVHGEPITFGVRIINYYAFIKRQCDGLLDLRKEIAVGKLSGAMGMYTMPPEVEMLTGKRLGLRPTISTQIIPRDIIAKYTSALSFIARSIQHIADNIRLMQTTEVREVQEFFSKFQKGSSAMPHKRNPIASENLSGMAAVVNGFHHAMMELIPSWYERDLRNSGPERIILGGASMLVDYMIKRQTSVIEKMLIYPKRIQQNLSLTKGLIFSQGVMSLLAEKSNIPREEAYEIVKYLAQRCWDEDLDFQVEIRKNARLTRWLSDGEIEGCFDVTKKITNVDHIFKMAYGDIHFNVTEKEVRKHDGLIGSS
jgi:adenylosuccinate lyase